MPDYAKTVIYQIECKDVNINKTYGGHSTNLIKRRQKHKSDCNNTNSPKYNSYVYQFIRENGGWNNWQVVWQYDYPCENKREAELEETKYVKENKCELNSVMPFLSKEERKKGKELAKTKRIANETQEEKAERKEKETKATLKCRAKKRAKETEEEKKERLRIRREKKENETEEQKKERNRKEREYNAKYRAKKKAEKEAQKNLMENAPLTTI
tara:strand:+ start:195 stop:833 length:639 start_codon:yes stop_codon:yes gene_type:complete